MAGDGSKLPALGTNLEGPDSRTRSHRHKLSVTATVGGVRRSGAEGAEGPSGVAWSLREPQAGAQVRRLRVLPFQGVGQLHLSQTGCIAASRRGPTGSAGCQSTAFWAGHDVCSPLLHDLAHAYQTDTVKSGLFHIRAGLLLSFQVVCQLVGRLHPAASSSWVNSRPIHQPTRWTPLAFSRCDFLPST